METRTIWTFCLASFTSHVFRLPPCCSTDQFFTPFHDWIIFHHVDAIFYLSLPQSRDIWVVSAFWLLWIVLLWIFMPKFLFEHLFSVLLSIYVKVGSLGHMVLLYLTYWRIKKKNLFSTASAPFCVPLSNEWGLQFPHMLTNTYFPFLPFNYNHPSGCKVLSPCGFILHFLHNYWG